MINLILFFIFKKNRNENSESVLDEMRKIKILFVLFFILTSSQIKAQEGLYLFNYLNYNPAYAGSENNLAIIPVQMYNLYSDKTYYHGSRYIGSAELQVNKINSAFGYQYNYENLSTQYQLFHNHFTYNYEIKLKENIRLRLGTQLSKTTEVYFSRAQSSQYNLDFGTWLNAGRFYTGISTVNLFFDNKHSKYINIIAGYKFEYKNLSFTPSAIYAVSSLYVGGLRADGELNATGLFSYKNQYNLGLTYGFPGQIQVPGIIAGVELFKRLQLMGSCSFNKNLYTGRYSEYGFIVKYKIGQDKKWF